jgi:divalent metal cation (Fe/Co/Zn/Cd) transporter
MDETDETMVKELIEMLQQERRVNWIDLHNLRIIKYGPTLHLDCHLTVPWYFNVNEAHREVDMLDKLVKDKYGSSVEMFIHTDGCIEFSCAICSKGDCNVRKHPFIRSVKWDFNNITGNVKHHAEIQ